MSKDKRQIEEIQAQGLTSIGFSNRMDPSPTQNSQNASKTSFKIMIMTDNHMGYAEKNPLLHNDSFEAVEEILLASSNNQVDFVIQGGDLFHQEVPSQSTLKRGIEIFANAVYGDKLHQFSIINQENPNSEINFKSGKVQICLPIFCIHGNHDYPQLQNSKSVLELLSTAKLVNYFGKHTSMEFLHLKPICFQKRHPDNPDHQVGIALYGIGHMRDQSLRYLLKKKKYEIHPPEDEDTVSYFKILVMHQNRFKGAQQGVPKKNSIEFKHLPQGFDLVIWGHEHDCYTDFEWIHCNRTRVYQPGSSVAISLTHGESLAKHVGILEVDWQCKATLKPILIRSQRRIGFRLMEYDDLYCKVLSSFKDFGKKDNRFELIMAFEDHLRDIFRNVLKDLDQLDYGYHLDSSKCGLDSEEILLKRPLVRLRIRNCPQRKDQVLFRANILEKEFKQKAVNE